LNGRVQSFVVLGLTAGVDVAELAAPPVAPAEDSVFDPAAGFFSAEPAAGAASFGDDSADDPLFAA
jgi:hypothetical protein